MHKILRNTLMVLAIGLMLTGCSIFMGDDGKAYVMLTIDDYTSYGFTIEGALISGGGLPSSGNNGDYYEISEGSYSLYYVLYDDNLYDVNDDGYNDFRTDFNDSWGTYVWTDYWSTYNWDGNHTYYVNNLFSSRANYITYTITVNEGELFSDGSDKYFTIYLDWVASYSSISSLAVSESEAKIIEDSDDMVVKEITDGPYTLRIEIRKTAAPEITSEGIMMQ